MGDVVVVEADETDGGGGEDQAVALAAGAAAVTAEQAEETAEQAEETAEQAAQMAEVALETAWDAQAAHSELRSFTEAGFAELGTMITALGERIPVPQETAPVNELAPEEVAEPEKPKDDDGGEKPEKKGRKWGNDGWFGDR